MATYQTHQKKDLVAFLERHRDRAFTIEELASAMQADPSIKNPPGKSTIYRIMPALLDDHLVARLSVGTGRKSVYQIVGGHGCHAHMHMKCTACGKLFHMKDDQSARLMKQILQQTRFTVDLKQTLIYGTCAACRVACQTDSRNDFQDACQTDCQNDFQDACQTDCQNDFQTDSRTDCQADFQTDIRMKGAEHEEP